MKLFNKKLLVFILAFCLSFLFGCSSVNTLNENVTTPKNELKVHFLDVGQGDSIFIELPNKETILIDASAHMYSSGITKYIKKLGYSKINYIIATHPHADHIGGMVGVINSFDFDKIYMTNAISTTSSYKNLLKAIQEKGKKMTRAQKGVSIINDEDLKAEFVAPVSDSYENLNNYSAVLKLTYNNNTFLFAGDIEALAESEINDDIKSDVLKVAHHGSGTSTTESFLKKVSPKYAVISCGKDNDYGHPHKQVVDRLNKYSVKIYRTDLSGTIIFISDGENITISETKTTIEDTSPEATPTDTPAQSKYVLNTSSKKIHYITCSSVSKMNEDNYLETDDFNKATSEGYSPCQICKPAA
jgi:competence protein ComEC